MLFTDLSSLWLRVIAILVISVTGLLVMTSVGAQQTGTARYFYDNNGRLHAVMSPTGDAVVYEYDSAGNFTSITRHSSTEASIIDFTPGSGNIQNGIIPATQVTIYGTGFNTTTPSANIVKFHGVTATINSVPSSTQMVVTVPNTATTGTISITTLAGTATSSKVFNVVSEPVAFTGNIAFGDSLTTTLSTANRVAVVSFEGQAEQRISLFMDNVTFPNNNNTFAQVSIITPNGGTLATATVQVYSFFAIAQLNFGYIDALVLPATGTYSIIIDPPGGGTGALTLHLYDVPPDVTGTINLNSSATITFAAPGQKTNLTFNVTAGDIAAGQKISLLATQDVETLIGTIVKIVKPSPPGGDLYSNSLAIPAELFSETLTPTTPGTYTIVVDPAYNKTRPVMLSLYNVPPDVSPSLTIGGAPVDITISAPGQNALLTFNVASTQQVTVHFTNNTFNPAHTGSIRLERVSDSTLITSGNLGQGTSFNLSTQTLAPGAYRIKIDPVAYDLGSLSVSVTSP